MIANGIGGANTKTGLVFEGKVDLATFLSRQNGYIVDKKVLLANALIVRFHLKQTRKETLYATAYRI